ncbi:MAG: autotransporter-associated beta strand repeat-containing protein [Verrucomicrobiota bacterium]
MKTKSIKRFQIHKSLLGGTLLAALFLRFVALLGAGLLLGQSGLAQSTYYWVGRDWTSGAANGAYWNYNNNWSTSSGGSGLGSAIPSLQNYLNFDGSAVAPANGLYNTTNNLTAGSGGFQIYFKSTAPAYNLYGNSITFYDYNVGGTTHTDPNIQNEGTANTQTINFPIVDGNVNGVNGILNINLNASTAQGPLVFNGTITAADALVAVRALNVSGTNAVTFNGALSDFSSSGKLALTQLGTGGVTLTSANNSYSGATTINTGRMTISTNPKALSTNTAVTVAAGAQMLLGIAGTYSNNFTINSNGIADVNGGTTVFVGAIRCVNNNVLSNGVITLAGNSRIGIIAGAAASDTIADRITGNFGLDYYAPWNNFSSGTATFLLNNPGTASDYTGDTTIRCGFYTGTTTSDTTVVKLGANEQIPNGAGKGNLVLSGASANFMTTFELNGFNETVNGISAAVGGAINTIQNTATGASVLTIGDANTNSSFSGNILDGGTGKTLAITKIGTGTLTLSGANTYSGPTTNSAGTLTISGAGTLGGGTYATNLVNNGTLNYNSSASQNLSGIISGTGALNYLGTGGLTLSVSNTYSGGTTMTNGTVYPGNGSVFGTGTVTVNAGATTYPAANMTFTNAFILNGGTLRVGGGGNHQINYNGSITTTTTTPNTTNTIQCDGGTGYNASGGYWGAAQVINGNLDMGSNTNNLTCYGGDANGGITFIGSVSGINGTINCTASHLWLVNASNSFAGTIRSSVAGATVVFYTGNQSNNVTVDMNAADAGAFTFANPCTIGGLMGSRNLGISGALSIGQGNASTAYSGALTNTGSLTKIGTGTLTLSGTNTYSGVTTNNAGTLTIGGAGQLGGGTYAKLLINNAAFNYASSASQTLSGTISGTGSLTNAGIGTLTLSGTNTYSGATTVSAGKLVGVTGGSCSNSAVTVTAGTYGVQLAAANGQWVGKALTNCTGTYVDIDYNVSYSPGATVPLLVTGDLALTNTTILVRNYALLGVGQYPLIKFGGTLTVSGALTCTTNGTAATIVTNWGNKSIDLVVAAGGNTLSWATGSGLWDVNTNANWKSGGVAGFNYQDGSAVVLDDTANSGANNSILVTNGMASVSPASVTVNVTNKNYTLSGGLIAGGGGLTLNGPLNVTNTLTLLGTSSYSGGTVVNGATLVVNTSAALGTGLLTLNGGALSNNVSATLTNVVNLSSAGTIGVGNSQTLALSGAITNTGALTKVGVGTLTLAGNNTYGGATTVNAGTLSVTTGYLSTSTTINVASGATLAISANNGFSGGGTSQGGAWTIAGTITNSSGGTVDEIMPASVTLNNGTLSGATFASYGTFLSFTSATTITANGTNTISAGNLGDGTGLTFNTPLATDALTNSGYIGGTNVNGGYVTKSGAGTLTLSGAANTYTGLTTVNGGTLTLASGAGLSTSSAITVASGATLNFNSYNALTTTTAWTNSGTINNLNGVGYVSQTMPPTVILTNGKLSGSASSSGFGTYFVVTTTITANGTNTISAGNIGGGSLTVNTPLATDALTNSSVLGASSAFGLSLTKSGLGTLTLSGANIYTGGTTITAGTLVLGATSTLPSATAVTLGAATLDAKTFANSAGTLNVTNTGTINLGSGGTLAFADSSAKTWSGGILTITGTFVSGSSLRFGTTSSGLTSTQLGKISLAGRSFYLNSTGYLVGSTNTTTTVSRLAGSSPSTYGSPLTFKAAVVPAIGSTVPTGTVQFKTNGVSFGSAVTVVTDVSPNGMATINASTLPYNASTYTVTAVYTPADSAFAASTDSMGISQTINQATLTVTADNQSRAYGAANPSLTYTITGYQNGENATAASVTGAPSVSTTATTSSPVSGSPYTITCAANNLSAPNYTFSYVNGLLTINLASTSVGAVSTNTPCGYQDAVAFTATLPADASGTVVFASTNGAFGTNTVSGVTTTSLSITNLPRGTNVITVAYLGDGNYVGSTNTLNQIVTNHPPVANAVSYARSAAIHQIRIAVTNLLANASDVDGDTLVLASVGTPTNAAATLIVSGGWVMYYNTNAVADEFTYTVSDGFGGTNSATVTLTVDSTSLFGQASIPAVDTSSGSATLNFAGIPGLSYSVQRSTNVNFIPFDTLWTTNAPAGGLFQFIDLSAPTPSAFYRLQYNP